MFFLNNTDLFLFTKLKKNRLLKLTELPGEIMANNSLLGFSLKPLSHQTAMRQRLYSVLKPCQRAVGSPLNTPKISNLPVIACTQRPHSVPTASTLRSHSVFTASLTFSQRASSCCSVFTARTRRAYGAHTAFSRRAHSVLTAITAFKIYLLFILF